MISCNCMQKPNPEQTCSYAGSKRVQLNESGSDFAQENQDWHPLHNMPWSDEKLKQIIAQYTPVLHLHHKERYLPCSVEWYLERSQLWHVDALDEKMPTKRTLVLDKGQVNVKDLLEVQVKYPQWQLHLQIEPPARTGMPQSELNKVPLYVAVKEVVTKEGAVEAVEIDYCTFYAYNGPYTVGCSPLGLGVKAGAHDGDWEHFTVRLDAEAANMVGCYYNAHRPQDGQWLPADKMPKTATGQPIAFVALGAHGLYTGPGVHRRAWCAVNEHCSRKGPVWSSQHCIMMEPVKQVPSRGTNLQQAFNSAATAAPVTGPAVQVDLGTVDWLQYGGNFGSIGSPHTQNFWYDKAEHPVSRTWFQRVFWHCTPPTESLLEE